MKKLKSVLLVWCAVGLVIGYQVGSFQKSDVTEETMELIDERYHEEIEDNIRYLKQAAAGKVQMEDLLPLLHYNIQSDGRGLAIIFIDPGAMGRNHVILYHTEDGGKNWEVRTPGLAISKGDYDIISMGDVVVMAFYGGNYVHAFLEISYDRGITWSDRIETPQLFDYDSQTLENLRPKILNYNGETGIITFGWKIRWDDEDYALINQFDVYKRKMVEEIYRHPDFPAMGDGV